MLSSDRFEPPKAGHGAGTPGHAGASEPWDADTAEALTRLYESDEGQLHKPGAGERRPRPQAAACAAGPDDWAWLQSHLSGVAERLQSSLSRLDPDASFAALNRRLEAIEERFGLALERVAQSTDVQGLRAIEANVLDLAAHLERTRDRLEQIGTLEQEVRGLGQRVDEAGQQQLGALAKLLRDYAGEWRESEQRTAGALHNLEEAVNRLGDTVDAMEASKPAPDLSLSTLAATGPVRMAEGPLSPAGNGRGLALAPKSYHALLDAADYAPRTAAPERRASEPVHAAAKPALPGATIEWSAASADAPHSEPAARQPVPRVSRIMTLRAKLRHAQIPSAEAPREEDAPGADLPSPPIRRTRPGLLFIAGVAFLAGGAYLLVHALTAAAPPRSGPAKTEPAPRPAGVNPDLADPTPHPLGAAGSAG